jgi:hypothetical protein
MKSILLALFLAVSAIAADIQVFFSPKGGCPLPFTAPVPTADGQLVGLDSILPFTDEEWKPS